MRTGNYYNTNKMRQPELKKVWAKNRKQAELVYNYYKLRPNVNLSPSDVWQGLIAIKHIDPSTPLTSIRRAITDLTSDGKLLKLDLRKNGYYGGSEHFWVYNDGESQMRFL